MILKQSLKKQPERQHLRAVANAVSYRIPLQVIQVRLFRSGDSYPVCPRCNSSLEREYMQFCDRCGQRLGWSLLPIAVGHRVSRQ